MKNSLIILALVASLMPSYTYAKEHKNVHHAIIKKAIYKQVKSPVKKANIVSKKHTVAPTKKVILEKKKNHLVGVASWYGYESGPRTASGEYFNPKKFTAAHRHIDFGTKVKVTNLKNNKSVVVTVNDRGPYAKGRIIDLSKAAAKAIDIKGTEKVSLNIVG